MRTLGIVLAAFALAPAVAHATPPVQLTVLGPRSLAATSRFNMVGFHWQGSGTPWYRARGAHGWTAWHAGDDQDPAWVGTATALQVKRVGRVTHLREVLLWSPHVPLPTRRLQLAGSPPIVTRAQWQANEEIRRAPPVYAPTLQLAVVHHTASPNTYSCSDSASIVRGIEAYHVESLGWNDIGYNFLVDKCGNVFEGRYGGVDKNVVGAHALGFNQGTFGVSMIGTYETAAPPAVAIASLEKLLAWRLDVAHVDPLSTVTYVSGGNPKYRAGTKVSLHAIVGHRDVYPTSCPGSALYAQLPVIAQAVAKIGLPKLYAPLVSGSLGGTIHFTATLTSALPWTVTVLDPLGVPVAHGSGTGTAVDWTWDSSTATAGAYAWTIAAGPTVRPAAGSLGTLAATALALTGAKASPTSLDGTTTTTSTITYTLSAPANVTGELLNSDGTSVQTLFTTEQTAGAQTYTFSSDTVPDGNYTIRLTAQDATGHTATASVPVTISRTLLSFSADTKLVSPNGDGRRDTVTFSVALAQTANVTISLVQGTTTIPLFDGQLVGGDQEWPWSGVTLDGSVVPDGAYQATIAYGTPPLVVTRSVPLTIDTTAPTLSLVSLNPLRLRTSENSSVYATVNGKRITTSAKAGVFRIVFNGTVRTLHVVVRDAAGNQSDPVDSQPS